MRSHEQNLVQQQGHVNAFDVLPLKGVPTYLSDLMQYPTPVDQQRNVRIASNLQFFS